MSVSFRGIVENHLIDPGFTVGVESRVELVVCCLFAEFHVFGTVVAKPGVYWAIAREKLLEITGNLRVEPFAVVEKAADEIVPLIQFPADTSQCCA
jgi:hypothetical protein